MGRSVPTGHFLKGAVMWKTIAGGVAVALVLGIGGYSMYRPGELQKVVQTEHRLSGSPIAIPFGIGAPTSMWDSLKGQSVVKEFDRLDALAKAGDGKAALDAFHLTNYCGFTDSLKIVQKQTPMPELAQQIQVVTEACTGMTEDKIGRRSALVKQAA